MTNQETLDALEQWTAVIQGSSPFPMDMLRYDQCVPVNATDSCEILDSNQWANERIFTVKVTGRGTNGPTSKRWASFRWHVKKVDQK
jgi:hypothetical protein